MPEDRVADFEAAGLGAELLDDAGEVVAQHHGKVPRVEELHLAERDLVVGRVERGRVNADPDLAAAGLGHGQSDRGELLEGTVLGEADRSHCRGHVFSLAAG